MVITCSISTKQLFTTWFVPHTTNICVAKEDGGAGLDAFVGNGGYAPPEYIIKPDKSVISDKDVTINDAFIRSLGIKKHSCSTHAIHFSIMPSSEAQPLVCEINSNSFTMNVFSNNIYSIIFYSANGQACTRIPEQSLTAGMNIITFGNKEMAHGVYFTEITCGKDVTRQKLLLK